MKSAVTLCAVAALAFPAFAQSPYETAIRNLKFRSIGPTVMGGRVDDFAVVESDPRIIYVGAAAGGLFKTVNGGQSWQPLFDDEANPSIGDIALAPSNPSILYVGTGEPNNRQSSSWGNGVYKSMDAGVTWTHLGLAATHHIGRIVVHPADPNIVYVAALGDLWGPNPERGVYKSTDGGTTWTKVLFINDDTGVSDIAIDPQSPNILYAAAYQRRRTVFGYDGGGPGSGLYRSTDGGAHWTKLGGEKLGKGLPTTGDIGRCAVDIYRGNSNIVYALIEHSTLGGVYRSEDKGATWTRMSETNPRPSYFSQIRIDPNNDKKIWLGGVNMYMSEDGGKTFVQTRFHDVHSDVHAIWIDPADSDHILSGNDGGVWVTYDSGRNWRHINNLPLGQFYEIAYDFRKPYQLCGGLQDNYSWCGPSSTTQTTGIGNDNWITVQGGDGFYNRIDPSDPNIVYAESQDGNLFRRDLRTSESKFIRPQEDNDNAPRYRFQWNSPLMISPHAPHTIYYGGNYLFKSTDRGETWTRLGPDLTSGADRDKQPIMGKVPDEHTLSRDDGVVAWPCITAIAESPAKAGVLWVGTDDGNVQVSRDGGKTWTDVISHMPGLPKGYHYVSRIEPSHKDPAIAYIAIDDHRNADYGIYIYRTANYGDSFTRITDGIPPDAGTVHVIREDPVNEKLLFAGTEFGTFVSFDRGANWHRLKNGLPTVPVFDIQIQPRDHDLILATHGRSIWIMDDISALEQLNDGALSSDLKLFGSRPAIEYKMANYRGFLGTSNFLAPNAPNGLALDYYAKSAGEVKITVADKSGKKIRELTAKADAGAINRAIWDLRYDSPIPPATVPTAGRGGHNGRGGTGASPAGHSAAGQAGAAGASGSATTGPRSLGSRGPLVDPGDYTVTISEAGKSDSRTFTVDEDPRIQVSAADRARRRQAIDRLYTMARESDSVRKKAVAMNLALTSLTESWKQPGAPAIPDNVKKAATDLAARVKTAAARFESPRRNFGSAGPPPPYTPPPITQKVTRQLFTIDNYSAAPTARQMSDIDEAAAQLKKDTAQVDQLWNEVPKLNTMLRDAGVPYVTPNPEAVPPPTFGGRGDEN